MFSVFAPDEQFVENEPHGLKEAAEKGRIEIEDREDRTLSG